MAMPALAAHVKDVCLPADLLSHLLRRAAVHVEDGHARAFPGEPAADAPADARSASGRREHPGQAHLASPVRCGEAGWISSITAASLCTSILIY
jgi:hypothetical protein